MSTDKEYNFDDIATALKRIRLQHAAGEPLVWTGPDALHFRVAATSAPPSWQFSREGMDYHTEQGRSFWDVYTMVAFQIGYSNGVVREEKETKFWQRMAERDLLRDDREG